MRKCKIAKGLLAGHFARLHFHRAKPVSEMEQGGIERALRSGGRESLTSVNIESEDSSWMII